MPRRRSVNWWSQSTTDEISSAIKINRHHPTPTPHPHQASFQALVQRPTHDTAGGQKNRSRHEFTLPPFRTDDTTHTNMGSHPQRIFLARAQDAPRHSMQTKPSYDKGRAKSTNAPPLKMCDYFSEPHSHPERVIHAAQSRLHFENAVVSRRLLHITTSTPGPQAPPPPR